MIGLERLMRTTGIVAAAGLLVFVACARIPAPRPAPQAETPIPEPSPPGDTEERIQKAVSLAARGSYAQLDEAFRICDGLYSFAALKSRLAAPFLDTGLLLAVREKELGIWNPGPIDRSIELMKEHPELGDYRLWLAIAGFLWPKGRGVVQKIDERFSSDEIIAALQKAEPALAEGAARSPVFAYLYATYKWYNLKPLEKAEGLEAVVEAFPDSMLLKYKKAVCPVENAPLLEKLLAEEPEYLEAFLHLGVVSLAQGKLIEAEERFLKALPALSRSQALLLRLASVYFALEEVEESLAFFEKTIEAFADNRDALLGKAICLGLMGRNDEALVVLDAILAKGYQLVGEAHYWEAWNFHEKKDLERAASHIAESKGRLPTAAEVFALSGLVELEGGNLDAAEKDLQESLKFNSADAEAMFNLAKVKALKEQWLESAAIYRTSGFLYAETGKGLTAKMAEIRESRLSEARKARLLRKKEAQFRQAEISKATAFYNAAAGYANSGNGILAIASAQDAAAHPAMAGRAEELIALIKKRLDF